MQVKQIHPSAFGDEKRHTVINSIVGIFNEKIDSNKYNKNEYKYCTTLIKELNEIIKDINLLDNRTKKYVINLIRTDFLSRLKEAKLTDLIYKHMRCLIIGIIRNHTMTL